jgi:hypothetical protein
MGSESRPSSCNLAPLSLIAAIVASSTPWHLLRLSVARQGHDRRIVPRILLDNLQKTVGMNTPKDQGAHFTVLAASARKHRSHDYESPAIDEVQPAELCQTRAHVTKSYDRKLLEAIQSEAFEAGTAECKLAEQITGVHLRQRR